MIKFVRKLLTAADRSIEVQAAVIGLFAALLVAVVSAQQVRGQVPSVVGPFNVDSGAVITNVNQVAGIVNSANQNNLDQHGAVCTYLATAQAGQPSVNFSIQGFDAGTASWFSYATSQAITVVGTPFPIVVYPFGNPSVNPPFGPAFTVPANMQVTGMPLPRTWRVQEIVSGSGTPTVTAKIGCVLLR